MNIHSMKDGEILNSTSKRQDILEAALLLFAERGFDGTTVPMIADTAKVGAGTIYRYFENKEYLGNVLFQETVEILSETLKKDFPDANASIQEQFRHFFRQINKFAHFNIHALYFIDSHCNARFLDEKSNSMFEDFLDFLRIVILRGQEQKIICPLDADALIAIIYGAYVQVFKIIRFGVVNESKQLIESVEECCWNAIRVH